MLSEIIKIIKTASIVLVILTALLIAGNIIDNLINWNILTMFFGIVRRLVYSFDFALDTNALFNVLLASFSVVVAVFSVRAFLVIKNWFVEQ